MSDQRETVSALDNVSVLHRAHPRLEAELFVIPLDDRPRTGGRRRQRAGNPGYLVYAPLRRAAFVANAATLRLLADLKASRFCDASDPDGSLLEFLRRLEIVDAPAAPQPSLEPEGPFCPTSVTLLLTTACNLRCRYCYASSGAGPGKWMSLEMARRGIDFVASNARQLGAPAFEVGFHGGGEPTVHWNVLVGSVDHARRRAAELGLEAVAALATNGCLSVEQADWIVANLNGGVTVSFDGLPEFQDRNRPTLAGRQSSPRVCAALRRFDAAAYPYGIRVTVTHDQIGRLADGVEYICANFAPRKIQVEPVYQLGRWSEGPSAETKTFIDAFREAQSRAARHGRQIEFSAADVDRISCHFCAATRDLFALTAEGNVTACYEVFSEDQALAPAFLYGRPDDSGDGYRFDFDVLARLRRKCEAHLQFCRGCFAKWHCAGDCCHRALVAGGQRPFEGTGRCRITRELIRDQLLARIAAAGGLFWHEPPASAGLPQNAAVEKV